jgi:hypothetical protein
MHWWSIAIYVAMAVALALLGHPNHAIAMGCFALGTVVLGIRDRLHLMPSNRARDRRAGIVFAVFLAVLIAIPLVASAARAL